MQQMYDVIVIGGGAIGCAISWRLGQSGRKVLLLERGLLGGEASSAAGGMLGAQLEVKEPGPFYHLCLESRSLYSTFAEELYEETGIDVQYTNNGILRVAATVEEALELQKCMIWQVQSGGKAEWLTPEAARSFEPAVEANLGALFLPNDGNVMATHLTKALGAAAIKRADVVEGADVTNLAFTDSHVLVQTPGNTYMCENVVVAAGAWADKVLKPTGEQFGVKPVKGQMFAIRPTDSTRLIRTIFRNHTYLVPKRDGTILVGATEEHEAGYDRHVTIRALTKLFQAMNEIAPKLQTAKFERAWVGHRPMSSTGMPSIGAVPHQPRLYVAVGHFRNGILLTPITASMILSQMNGEKQVPTWATFQPSGSKSIMEVFNH